MIELIPMIIIGHVIDITFNLHERPFVIQPLWAANHSRQCVFTAADSVFRNGRKREVNVSDRLTFSR